MVKRPGFDEFVTAVLKPQDFQQAIWPKGEAIKQLVTFDGEFQWPR